jgi:hypothetical protein
MERVKLIGKLKPHHFARHADFDERMFASLVEALQLQAKKTGKRTVVYVAVFCLVDLFAWFVLSKGIGGAIGYGSAAVCYILSPVIAARLSVDNTTRQVKTVARALNITQGDINKALQAVTKEHRENESKTARQQKYPAGNV